MSLVAVGCGSSAGVGGGSGGRSGAGSSVGVGVDNNGTPTNPTGGTPTKAPNTTPPAGALNIGSGSADGTAVPPSLGLPAINHVHATINGNSARITFDPVAGAVDYRVYVAPQTSAIHTTSSGGLDYIDNQMYRCAGQRAANPVNIDGNAGPPANGDTQTVPDWVAVITHVDKQQVWYYTRSLAEATMGYAFADPVEGTVPVYAVGEPSSWADNYGYGIREPQTRAKLYVTDNTKYLEQGWRDDGVAFYAPSASSTACGNGATPVPVSEMDIADSGDYSTLATPGNSHLYYLKSGPEATFRAKTPSTAGKAGPAETTFYLCPSQAPSSEPLMRVFYEIESAEGIYGAGSGHDELALGTERFSRARCQGSTFGACAGTNQSNWEVHWSGITGPTQLVVEALDAGCPFQGLLGPQHVDATLVDGDDNGGNTSLMNDPIFTLSELQAAAPHGEVFVNGQFDGSPRPHPIARTAIQVSPATRPTMDVASDFGNTAETFTESLDSTGQPACGLTQQLIAEANAVDPSCDDAHIMTSQNYESMLFDIQGPRFTMGSILGELWTDYTGGKMRITPKSGSATMSDTAYLHAAMEVSSFSTGRRYPQIMVSTQDMVTSQWLLDRSPDGNGTQLSGGEGTAPDSNPNIQPVLVLNPIDAGVGRHILEVELCNQRPWEVNDHCPWFLLEEQDPTASGIGSWTSRPDLFDRFQDDRSVRYDIFVSTQKVYVYLDTLPYGCVDLTHRTSKDLAGNTINPTPKPPPAGPVFLAFGDVNYHEGAEAGYFQAYSSFHLNHELYETTRNFDYIGYSSNVGAPPWNENVQPCVTQMHQGDDSGTQTPEQ
jgi:hypothetical protein